MNVTNKPFSWSYSKLKSFEVCPRRYYETDVKKAWPADRSENLTWGDTIHKALAAALKNGTELEPEFVVYQPWVDKVNKTKGKLLIEDQAKWAITREFKPSPWFGKNVWLRTVADVVKLDDIAALIVDWKSGKSANVDEVQLKLIALLAFLHFPKLLRVRADFVWLSEDSQTTIIVDRHETNDLWAEIIPRVERLQQATVDQNFPPRPNPFCKSWCPVRTCEYFGT